MDKSIPDLIASLPVADTHEHLIEEEKRLNPDKAIFPNDIGLLFIQYIDADLISAGMDPDDLKKVAMTEGISPDEKWQVIRRWWPLIRFTGFGRVIEETVRVLYDIPEISDETWKSIDDRIRSLPQPGFYNKILREICGIDHCQINALDEPIFRRTGMPGFFFMDLCVSKLCSDFDPSAAGRFIDREVRSLDDCLLAIDKAFDIYGRQAVAIKNQSAYRRRLDYSETSVELARRSLQLIVENNDEIRKEDRKPLEDYLVNYTIKKAEEFDLPYKLHTGYHSGTGTMHLHHVRKNASDMADLCRRHPDTKFILMHITYPYQNELLALVKHYPNALVDMCWSWMINPLAAVEFLKNFTLSVPINKLLAFGGDVSIAELVSGHLSLTRRGIALAVDEMLREKWFKVRDIEYFLERILYRNALEVFPVARLREQSF
jgi:hypothetical protein